MLDLVSSGGYEADSEALIGSLQLALSGLGRPQHLNLAPLQTLVSQPTDWTGNAELKIKARDLVAAAGQGAVASGSGDSRRSVAEIQRDIDDTYSMLRVPLLAEHRRARLQSEADGFIVELHARQESKQQAAAFTSGQALRIQEVRELLKAEIEMHEKGFKRAASVRSLMGYCKLFLQPSISH